jgi:hypothetical protein
MTMMMLLGACTAHAICVAPVGWAWIALGAMKDFAVARQVLRYEFAYAGVFVAYVLLLFADGAHNAGWVVWLARGVPLVFWTPPELIVVLGGCVLLGLSWWWRLARILPVVRWTNF